MVVDRFQHGISYAGVQMLSAGEAHIVLLHDILMSLLVDRLTALAWVASSVVSVTLCVCVCVYARVRALRGKRLELSTPNLVHTWQQDPGTH